MAEEFYFAIRDGSKRKARPCAFMRFSYDDGFRIEISEEAAEDDVPAFFIPFVERGELELGPEVSMRWIRERIPPSGRQNLGEILSAHSLSEYNELELLRSGRGESSQDSFIVQEIDLESYSKREIDGAASKRKALGMAIKERRVNLGLSQKELADELGISQPALSNIESGKSNITFDLLTEIDECLQGDELPFLRIVQRSLWTRERCDLRDALQILDPNCAKAYARLIDLMEEYDRGSLDSSDESLLDLYFTAIYEVIRSTSAKFSRIRSGEMKAIDSSKSFSEFKAIFGDGTTNYFEMLSLLEHALSDYAKIFIDSNSDLLRLIAIANRLNAVGGCDPPLQEHIDALAALIEDPKLHELANRELKNILWRDALEHYEYALVDLSQEAQ